MIHRTRPSEDPLRVRLRRALPVAMKARDRAAVAALRSALAAIDNAEAVAAPDAHTLQGGVIAGAVAGLGAAEATRLDVTEDQVAGIVRQEVADRRAAAADYEKAGRGDEAARLVAEADALAAHLTSP